MPHTPHPSYDFIQNGNAISTNTVQTFPPVPVSFILVLYGIPLEEIHNIKIKENIIRHAYVIFFRKLPNKFI